MVTDPASSGVTRPVVSPTVAFAGLLLVYVTAPALALEAVTVNAASVTFLVAGGLTNASVGAAALETVSVLLALVAAAYWAVAACVASNDTSPAATRVIKFPEASMLATSGLLLLYVIAPLLLLVGRVVILNDASPYVFVVATENVLSERLDVPRATVRVLLVLVALAYRDVAAWVALKLTSPALTSVIQFPDVSMVATPVLLLA